MRLFLTRLPSLPQHPAAEVDKQLRQIMNTIYTMSVEAAEEYGLGYNLVAGANIAGFMKVADAMIWQGVSY